MHAGLAGAHQYQNASLAVHVAQIFMREKEDAEPKEVLPEAFVRGLEETRWPGRCQTVPDTENTNLTWFLDGAHTLESLDCCVKWFVTPEIALRPIAPSYVHNIIRAMQQLIPCAAAYGGCESSYSTALMDGLGIRS